MNKLERPYIESMLARDYFSRKPAIVAKDLLGRVIVRQYPESYEIIARIKEVAAWQGEENSSAKTMKYAPGIIGISTKFGNHLIDIATGSENRPSCITLIALDSSEGIIQGPGKVSKYLEVDKMFDKAPINHPSLWIGGEPISQDRVYQRKKSNVPENSRGFFYFR